MKIDLHKLKFTKMFIFCVKDQFISYIDIYVRYLQTNAPHFS